MITEALMSLRPNARFIVIGETVDGIEWLDEDQTRPTDDEILAEVTNVIAESQLKQLRFERNRKLAETDWVVTMHKEKGTNIPAAWKTYRQALRDITDTYTSLDDVVWPEKP